MRNLFLILVFLAKISFACDCKPLEIIPFTKSYLDSNYQVIFSGKVISVSNPESENSYTTFKILKLFKGKAFEITDVLDNRLSDCAVNFQVGEEWIVFANYWRYGKPGTDICDFTRKKASADERDYFFEVKKISYEGEIKFLEENFGIQEPVKKQTDMNHVNIQPETVTKMILVMVSMLILILFYFLINKFWKS